MDKRYRIAVIPGDGIGREVMPEGLRVLEAAARAHGIAFTWDELPWSCDYYAKHGRMMPEDWFETIRHHDAIYFGAVGWPATASRTRNPSGMTSLPMPSPGMTAMR